MAKKATRETPPQKTEDDRQKYQPSKDVSAMLALTAVPDNERFSKECPNPDQGDTFLPD